MTSRLSVLRNATQDDVVTDPFPHIVLRNAVDEALYEELESSFPGYDFFVPPGTTVADRKYLKGGLEALAPEARLPNIWKEFVEYHASAEFYRETIGLFGSCIREYYPRLESVTGKPLEEFTTVVRNKGAKPNLRNDREMMLDCQPYIDCTFTDRTMRGPHVDAPEELYAALLYMRDKDDDSTGGGLDVRRPSNPDAIYTAEQTIKYPSRYGFEAGESELVTRVPYERNTLVMFVNSWRSLHAVETRSAHVAPRRAVNIIGEVFRYDRSGLFQIEVSEAAKRAAEQKKVGIFKRAARKARRVLAR